MSDQLMGTPGSQGQNELLAQWLYRLLNSKPPLAGGAPIPIGEDVSLPGNDYHAAFYPHIPDFAMALLRQTPGATTHYAPLFFHLLSCPTCHRAYLETYDALRVALADETRPATTALRLADTSSLATTSPKLLVFLCQLLIGQARSLLQQAHRAHTDEDAWARTLLQQAMQISRHLMQGTLRQRALRDLVEVAALTRSGDSSTSSSQHTLSYSALVGSSSGTRGRGTLRRADTLSRPSEPTNIDLRAGSFEGFVTQVDDMLMLRLVDLDERLQGKFLLISIPLGTLLEPVRWVGGNPYAIRSSAPVSSDGTLITPLGRTDLFLHQPEDRNLLETLFKKIDVSPLEA